MANVRATDESFIGDFPSLSTLSTRYPANLQGGREASVTTGGVTTLYISNGTVWAPYATDGTTESLSADRTITASDDQTTFTCTTALNISTPAGLTPAPSYIAWPPSSGNLTLTPTGGATFNGSASALTRTLANNRNGVLVQPNPYTANDYSVSGS